MKKSMKLLVLGLVVAIVISVGVVCANNTTTATKSVGKSTTSSATTTGPVKLTQDGITKIVLAAHKDAKLLDVQLKGKAFVVKIQTAKGNRTLQIDGNTGKIIKDTADAPAKKIK
jgi:uncharacterized membrane protein YkoI